MTTPVALHEARSDAAAARRSTWADLPNGYRLGLDSPPGIGWRLEHRNEPNRYFYTREQALARLEIK